MLIILSFSSWNGNRKFKVDEGFEAYQGLYNSIMDAAQSRIYAGEPK
jgi:hypothetical protein